MKKIKLFLILAFAVFAAGCASYSDLPPGTVKEVFGPDILELEREVVEVAPEEEAPPPSPEYLIGIGDVLFVNVAGRPELGSPVFAGSTKIQGSRVDGVGNIHLPLVGAVAVAGLSVEQAQTRLQESFRRYLNGAWVVVEVAEFRSRPIYLLGQFKAAGTYYLDRPLTLLQGLALGGGMLDSANLRSARLIRDNRTLPVDIHQLIQEGGARQNVWLNPGDTIYVPDDKNQNVFVFGAVARPGPVPMPTGRLNLGQALAAAGVGETRGHLEYVRIIRSLTPTRGELIVVDVNQILRGQGLPYPLMEGDIIYVPRSAVGNWNQAIAEILPSLQAISAVLQPFVQIRFLTRD